MTTTSVKSVGNVMNLGAAASTGAAGKAAEDSFQAVWNNRSDQKSPTEVKSEPADKIRKTEKVQKAEDDRQTERPKAQSGQDSPKAAEANGSQTKVSADQEPSDVEEIREIDGDVAEPQQTGEPSDEDLEQIMEVIAAVVTDLIGQIADTFQIPVEDVQELMTQMDLEPADLLQPDNLNSLLLEAGGAQDSLALLTDEKLYGDFQKLTEQAKDLTRQGAEQLQMTPEEFGRTVEKVAEEMPREPRIEVSVEKEEPSKPAQIGQPADMAQAQEAVQTPENAKEASAGHSQSRHQDKDSGAHGQTGENPFLAQIRSEQFQPEVQDVQAPASAWDADTSNIMRQIMDYMKIQVRPNVSSLEMQLHPASLGTIQIQIASRGGALTANFVTQNEAVKAALESQMVQLKESFAQQGVKVEAIEVTVQTHQFEENLEQGRGRQPEGSNSGRGRSRRGGLNIPGDIGDDEAQEDLQQTVSGNGSTVNYTA